MLSKIIYKLGLKPQNSIYNNLTEDAQSRLRKYLSQLKLYSSLSKDSSEVYEDIHSLISEKIADEFQNSHKKLTLESLTKILDKIGTPKEILSNNDIDVEKLIEANPLFRINLAISNFAIGENKVLSVVTRVIGILVTITVIALVSVLVATFSDIQLGLRDSLYYDLLWEGRFGYYTKGLAITFVPLMIFALASFLIPYTKKVSNNIFYVANILVFVLFLNTLLQNGGSTAQRVAILINNYRSAAVTLSRDGVVSATIGEIGFKEIDIEIRVNQINDVPNIFIIKADQRFGAMFSYPNELSDYGDSFLYANPDKKSLKLSYDATGYRDICGIKCLVARGSNPELYVYADENVKVNIKYNFSHEMSMSGYGNLPLELQNLENLQMYASSSNGSVITLKGINVNKFNLELVASAELSVGGDFQESTITNRDDGVLNMGFHLIALNEDFNLQYNGYNRSMANFAYLGDSSFDLYDNAVLMYLDKGEGEYKITKHSDDVTVIK